MVAEPIGDERGWFARTFDAEVFAANGLDPAVVQCNVSYNARAGTLRGMHFQRDPHGEDKLVRCQRGAIFDVIVDLREGSPTYRRWEGFTLSEDNHHQLYVPAGFAHGFLAQSDEVIVMYKMSAHYDPAYESGVSWNDPAIGIVWPLDGEPILSAKDAAL